MTGPWRCGWVLASTLLALPLILSAPPALALYLFLDSNGDGQHTQADVVSPNDTTRITLYLDVDQIKNGTTADCSHAWGGGDHPYSIILRAAGGTVAWGHSVVHQDSQADSISYESDDSTYIRLRGSVPSPGVARKVRLAALTVLIRRGRPAIEVVDRCPVHRQEDTRLSTGTWYGPVASCADGLPYGGQANRPPSMRRLSDYPICAGTAEKLRIIAYDPDADSLTFRLKRGPSFITVTTLNPGRGGNEGEVRVAPDSCVRGSAECVIEVSDGFASDADTVVFMVHPIVRPLPASPMQAPMSGDPRTVPHDRPPVDSTWLAGEWEWHETWGRFSADGPARRGYRRRLIFHRNGELEMFEIGSDRVLRAQKGTFTVAQEPLGTRLTIINWLDALPYRKSESFAASKRGPSSLRLYPWQTDDGQTEIFVRVPAVRRDGVPTDTARVIAPIDTPSVRVDHRVYVTLPKPMRTALKTCDPAFQLWEETDSRELGADSSKGRRVGGASAIIGDFDGDLLRDVALLGRSGADQVVIAILSDHGNMEAVEVAWRRVRPGQGENASRGDPQEIPPIYLERAPRGSRNPFCWVRRWSETPVDAIGIVEPGVARFDYVLDKGQFVLFAPVP